MNWQDIGTPTKNLRSFLDRNIKTTKSISVAVPKYLNDFTIIISPKLQKTTAIQDDFSMF